MKKHSPNFFENLQEADTANNNRATTFGWVLVLIGMLLFGFSITKTKAQDSIKIKGSERILFGTVIDYGEALQIRTADTIPVIMMVSDTSNQLQTNVTFVFDSYNPYTRIDSIGNIYIRTRTEENDFKALSFYPHHPIVMIGYEVTTIVPILFESGQRFYPGMPTTEKKIIYLNHKKQPLPDRLIVWMAVRRKEK